MIRKSLITIFFALTLSLLIGYQTVFASSLSSPVIVVPTSSTVDLGDVPICWNPVSGAYQYAFAFRDMTSGKLIVPETKTRSTSYTIRTDQLEVGHQYKIFVAAEDSASNQWPTYQYFTVKQPPGPPPELYGTYNLIVTQGDRVSVPGTIASESIITKVTLGVDGWYDNYQNKYPNNTTFRLGEFVIDTSRDVFVNPGTYTLTIWAKTQFYTDPTSALGTINLTIKPRSPVTTTPTTPTTPQPSSNPPVLSNFADLEVTQGDEISLTGSINSDTPITRVNLGVTGWYDSYSYKTPNTKTFNLNNFTIDTSYSLFRSPGTYILNVWAMTTGYPSPTNELGHMTLTVKRRNITENPPVWYGLRDFEVNAGHWVGLPGNVTASSVITELKLTAPNSGFSRTYSIGANNQSVDMEDAITIDTSRDFNAPGTYGLQVYVATRNNPNYVPVGTVNLTVKQKVVEPPVVVQPPVFEPPITTQLPQYESPAVILDGSPLSFDVPPRINSGRTMVPLRKIFESLGATVEWNGDLQKVTATKNGTTISLKIWKTNAYINGRLVALDVPPMLVYGRTLVPLRFVSESLGCAVDWNEDTQTVTINSVVRGPAITVEKLSENAILAPEPYAGDGSTDYFPLNASASQAQSMAIVIDGVQVQSSNSDSISYQWGDLASIKPGRHTITFRATDASGNQTAKKVSVRVSPIGNDDRNIAWNPATDEIVALVNPRVGRNLGYTPEMCVVIYDSKGKLLYGGEGNEQDPKTRINYYGDSGLYATKFFPSWHRGDTADGVYLSPGTYQMGIKIKGFEDQWLTDNFRTVVIPSFSSSTDYYTPVNMLISKAGFSAGYTEKSDLTKGLVQTRVVNVLNYAVDVGFNIKVTYLRSGPSQYVEGTTRVSSHYVGRGCDIGSVGGSLVNSSNAEAKKLVQAMLNMPSGRPGEIGCPWDPSEFSIPYGVVLFTDSVHKDHIHFGWKGWPS